MGYSVAIDGPAGAGKSTIAKRVAAKMNFIYVDTGAMFRAMAIHFLKKGVDAADEDAVSASCGDADITIAYEDGKQQVYLNGENVTGGLREEKVGNMASVTAGNKRVREKLLELQRKLAETSDVVMDGRDIGTCVLPGADVKIYLTASVRTRAMRRFEELKEKGEACDLAKIEQDIAERDERDKNRKIAPLKKAEDAMLIDSSYMSIEEVTEAILGAIRCNRGE